jgi:hypothetical protein
MEIRAGITMKTRLILASIAVFMTLLSGLRVAAAAGEDPEELIQEGVKLRRRGENARAEGYFLRAYQLAATPRSAAQLGLVELALGEFVDAETHLSEALGKRDAWVSEHKQAIEDGRTAARKHLVRVELAPLPAETTVSIAGAPPVAVAADGVVWLAAKKPATLRLEAPGHKGTAIQVEGAEGETRHVSVDLPSVAPAVAPAAPPVAPPTPSPAESGPAEPTSGPTTPPVETRPPEAGPAGHGLRVSGIVVGAVGAAAAVAGAVLLAQASSKESSLQSDLNAGTVTTADYNSRNSSWKSERTLGIVCAIGGGVALGAGAVLYLVGRQQATPEEGAKVSLIPGPGFGLLSLSGSF